MTSLAHLISLRHHYSTGITTTLKNVKATRCTIKKTHTQISEMDYADAKSCLHQILTILIKEFEYNKKIVFTTGLNACFPLSMDFVGIHAAVNTSISGKMGDCNVNSPLHNRHATITPPGGTKASLCGLLIQ